jgi:hypothetical protein
MPTILPSGHAAVASGIRLATGRPPEGVPAPRVKGEYVCSNDDLIRNAAYSWSPMGAAEISAKTGIEQRRYTARDLEEISLEAARAALSHAGRDRRRSARCCSDPAPIPG